jgi:type I restriction-modification system DNA methylase subunit
VGAGLAATTPHDPPKPRQREVRDSLVQEHTADAGTYSLVLANPPFAGSLDYESTAKDLQKIVKTKNNLPDVLRRWKGREGGERERPRTAQSFCVPKAGIAASGTYDLSLNRYRELEHEAVEHDAPAIPYQMHGAMKFR